MREPRFKLTALAECAAPRCSATVYAELTGGAVAGFLLCVDCEDFHAPRLTEAAPDPLFARSGGRVRSRGLCSEDCCRRGEA